MRVKQLPERLLHDVPEASLSYTSVNKEDAFWRVKAFRLSICPSGVEPAPDRLTIAASPLSPPRTLWSGLYMDYSPCHVTIFL